MRRAKPRKEGSDSGGEGYLASVSDLMAGLVFVFVITLAVFALRLAQTMEEHEDKTKSLTSARKTRERILNDIKDRLERADITVEIIPDQGILRLSEKGIRFESGIDRPKKDHEPRVGELARVLAEVLPCYTEKQDRSELEVLDRPEYCSAEMALPSAYICDEVNFPARLETLLIEGHTDSLPVGSNVRARNNLELSSMRAASVQLMMSKCEPRLSELQNLSELRILSVSGYGATRLAEPSDPYSEKNRRIDLRFLMELPATFSQVLRSDVVPISDSLKPAREVSERYRPDGA